MKSVFLIAIKNCGAIFKEIQKQICLPLCLWCTIHSMALHSCFCEYNDRAMDATHQQMDEQT